MRDINLDIQAAQQTPIKVKTEKTTFRNMISKLLETKDEEKTLKAFREEITYCLQNGGRLLIRNIKFITIGMLSLKTLK